MAPDTYDNFHVVLCSRPKDLRDKPRPENFSYRKCDYPKCSENDVIIRTLYICMDSAMRCRMNENAGDHNLDSWPLAETIDGLAGIGVVIESTCPAYQIGNIVEGMFGWPWKFYFSANESVTSLRFSLRKMKESYVKKSLISLPLSCLGMVGITSVLSLTEMGRPLPGDTCVVADAVGAYGSITGQIAKILGCSNVVGICETEEECKFAVDKFNYSAAVNRNSKQFSSDLKLACPAGVNIFIDNYEGKTSNKVILQVKRKGRVVLYDQTTPYNASGKSELPILSDSADTHVDMGDIFRERFLPLAYTDHEKWEKALGKLHRWVMDGRLIVKESTYCGLETTGIAFSDMMHGRNIGATVVKVSEMAK